MSTRIGTYVLTEPTEFTNSSYETAAWWSKVLVPAGEYPVVGKVDENGQVEDDSISVALTGVCTAAHFPALWGGVPIGNVERGRDPRIGKPETYHLRPYAHSLARVFLQDEDTRYRLDGFVAVWHEFVDGHGVPRMTADIQTFDARRTNLRVLQHLTNLNYSLGRVDAEDEKNPPPAYLTNGLSKAQRRENLLRAIRQATAEMYGRLEINAFAH
jgi:hypothetical protein